MAATTFICNTCKAEKPMEDYSKRNKGRRKSCKQCRNNKRKERSRKYAEQHRDKWRVNKRRANFRQYGITLEQYELMAKNQNGECAICGNVPTRRLDVDHCHKTGKIRGLLCLKCNTSLGKMNDDPRLFMKAAQYLLGF